MSARSTSRAQSIVAAVLCLAGVTMIAPPARAQSLADVAKKEEDRRKATAAPTKVYTNKDLNQAAAGSPPPPPAAKPGADADADAKSKAAKTDDDKPKDQAYWAGRLKALQDAQQRDQNYADAMQTRVNALTTELSNRGDPGQRIFINRDLQKAATELANLNKGLEATKKAITDLYEEARRAGVPPGWLR